MSNHLRKIRFSPGTLVLLALTVSALIGLNIAGMRGTNQKIGWPYQIFESQTALNTSANYGYGDLGRVKSITPEEHLNTAHVVADAHTAIGIVVLMWLLSEYMVLPVVSKVLRRLRPAGLLPRLHLSTAVVLMLAAFGLLWLVVRPQRVNETFDEAGRLIQYESTRGWPVPCYNDSTVYLWWRIDPQSSEPAQQQTLPVGTFKPSCVALDLAVGTVCLFELAAAWERIIRSRSSNALAGRCHQFKKAV